MLDFDAQVTRIALFAPQGCSLLSLGAMSEPFLLANQLLGCNKYQLSLLTCADSQAPIVDNTVFRPASFVDQQDYDLLIVIAEQAPQQALSLEVKKSLQRYYRQHEGTILTVKAGLWWLLESGIGLQHEWAVHWSLLDDVKDCFANVTLSHHLYQNSGRLNSCAGQLACLDYLLDYLVQHEQQSVVNQISDHLCLDRVRTSDERQRLPSQSFAGEDVQPRLTMAIELMQSHIEEPLTCDEIANRVSISRRQLERLFKRYMNTMPARHYLQIRLKRAQHLLQSSNMSIVQIGLSCGFSSGPHFSSSYKSFYQSTPREERSKNVAKRNQ